MDRAVRLRAKRSLSAADLRALLKLPADPARKQAQLDALVGSMTEEEANEMEQRINKMCGAVDKNSYRF